MKSFWLIGILVAVLCVSERLGEIEDTLNRIASAAEHQQGAEK